MAKNKLSTTATRRKFLGGAAVAGVATIAMPQVSRAQTVTLKMQGGWGATDILNDYGQDYAAKVNEMGGGRLKIDYLNAGAVVKPFSVMDATLVGRARRQPQRAGLLVRQASRRLAVRHRPGLRHQRRPVHGLVLLRRRRGALSTS